jgi:hydroxymethylbilane synthase
MTAPADLLAEPLVIGTRGSDLALWQSRHIQAELQRHWGSDLRVELDVITTKGDMIQDRPLHEVGGKGLFVKGIQTKLLDRSVDLAVHSMKDLPAETPPGLRIACMPKREDPRDALCVGPDGREATLAKLPKGTRVGTGSLRRGALVRRINPGVEVVPIRGNVPTRLEKAASGEVDAVILAAAGLRRLGLADRISECLDPERFCPAPAQGILALESRADDTRVQRLLEPLRDADATTCAAAERAFLQRLGASCTVPVGCHAQLRAPDVLTVSALIVDESGRPCFMATRTTHSSKAAELGRRLAEELLALGATRVADLGDRQVA